MCRRAPLIVAVVLLALAPTGASASVHAGACASAHASVQRNSVREARLATLCLLNRVRANAGLRALRLNPKLSHVAGSHSRDMVQRGYFAHNSPNGSTPFQRILGAHYVPRNSSWWLAENIGWGGGSLSDPAAVVQMWMHSPPHRANILSGRYREIGIGIAVGVPLHGAHAARQGGATYTTDFGSHS